MPLNGNLDNQGLSVITQTSGTAKYKIFGKIGQGLDLSSCLAFNCSVLAGCKQFSVAFWVKIEDDSSITTNWQDVVDLADQTADNSSIGTFRAETCYTSGNNYYGVHWHDNQLNAICNIPTNLAHYYGTNNRGVWKHCVMTCNTDSFIKIYCDGVFVRENTINMNGGHLTGVFRLGNNGNIVGCLNDLRIYNHILSEQKIKKLSQGLVLHLPLSHEAFGTKNLLAVPVSSAYWSLWGSNWDSTNVREKIIEDGKTWVHVIQNTSTGYGGYSCSPGYNLIEIDTTKRYTWSCLAKAGEKQNAEIILWCHWRSTQGGANLSQSMKKIQLTSTPKRISWTLPVYIDANYTVNRINLMIGSLATANNEIYFTDLQFEEGEIATPYIPNINESKYSSLGLNENCLRDISGYNHNTTIVNPTLIDWDSNMVNLKTSTVFKRSSTSNSVNNIGYLKIDNFWMPDEFTISFWWYYNSDLKLISNPPSSFCYGTDNGNATDGIHSYDGRYLINLAIGENDTKDNQLTISNVPYPDKEWSYITITFDGYKIKVYRNGELFNENTASTTKYHIVRSAKTLIIGYDRAGGVVRGASGNMSDFRIYATVLSADEILYLYEKR